MCAATSDRRPLRAIWAPLLSAVLSSCATSNQLQGDPALFEFLHDGTTTRDEVMLKLGQPSATYQSERIVTYRVGETGPKSYFIETPSSSLQWQRVTYSLVLIFDAGNTLQKHSLVPVQ